MLYLDLLKHSVLLLSWSCCNKIPQTERLINKKHFFLAVLKARNSKLQVPAWSCPMRALFLACRLLPSHHVLTCQKEEALVSLSLLIRALIPS